MAVTSPSGTTTADNTGQTAFPSTAVVVENSFNNVFGLGDINTVFKDGTVSCQNQISF